MATGAGRVDAGRASDPRRGGEEGGDGEGLRGRGRVFVFESLIKEHAHPRRGDGLSVSRSDRAALERGIERIRFPLHRSAALYMLSLYTACYIRILY